MSQLELKRNFELERVVKKLVELFYPELEGLDFIVLMRSKEFDGSPRTIARIEKLAGVKAWLFRQMSGEQYPIFLIQVVEHKFELNDAGQKIAIIDHELSHVEFSDTTGEPVIQPIHDVEENAAIVRRHGLYHEGLAILSEAIEFGVENESGREYIRKQILEGDDRVEL